MVSLLRSLALVLMCLAFAPMALALDLDKPAWEGGKLARLARYIGTDNHDAVVNDPHVKAGLQRLTGPYYERFMRTERIRPIEYHSNNILILRGGHVHTTENERKIIAVELRSGRIYASLYADTWCKIFSGMVQYSYLPLAIMLSAQEVSTWDRIKRTPESSSFEWKKAPDVETIIPQGR